MAITTALAKIKEVVYELTFYKVIQGGEGAGKTYAIITILIGYCQSYRDSVVTVVGVNYTHIKNGVIRDFKKIMQEQGYWDESRWSVTSKTYNFENGSVLEFLSVDKMGAHGPRRSVLFVNEANSMSWEVFEQLSGRTNDFVIIDYNPSAKFWAHEKLVEAQPERTSFLVLTYLDNEAIATQERETIESHRPKPGEEPSNWWTVYGLGQIGSLDGNIYAGWQMAEPEEVEKGRLVRYGLDFGFSNDESALVAIYEHEDGSLGVVEKLYKRGILGSQFPEVLRNAGISYGTLIVADSARPEIIEEIRREGFRIVGADKNAGSVLRGIDRVKERQILYYGDNLRREYLSYAWRKKRTGETIDEPQDGNDHLMDALRYAVDDLSKKRFNF